MMKLKGDKTSKLARAEFRLGLLCQGYRAERYYWEVVVAMRKVSLVFTSSLLINIEDPMGVRIAEFQVHLALLLIFLSGQ